MSSHDAFSVEERPERIGTRPDRAPPSSTTRAIGRSSDKNRTHGGVHPDKSKSDRPVSGRLLLATFRLVVSNRPWTGVFSRRHPEVTIVVINRTEVNAVASVSDHWISGRPVGAWRREIAKFPDVLAVKCLAEVGDGALYRITFRNPPVINFYRRIELPLPFPIRIRAGIISWEVVAREPEFLEILRFARESDPNVKVLWTRRGQLRSHLPVLTGPQRSLLRVAMVAGYFAVPRGVTVTGLAQQLGRSKSSVSEALAVIEGKLMESALRPASFLP